MTLEEWCQGQKDDFLQYLHTDPADDEEVTDEATLLLRFQTRCEGFL